jgi:6-pyruvoyltetrahydropterin/6-carboxytetrahydropterin synthase
MRKGGDGVPEWIRRESFGAFADSLLQQVKVLNSQQPSCFRVTREIEFCYGHRLLNYEGKCRHLHGHNGRAVITLLGSELGPSGMLVDFGEIKRKVQRWIDDHLDHNLLLCRDDPLLPLLREQGERVFEMDCNPTAENIARLIYEQARQAGLPVVEVVLWETEHCFATYSTAR